MTPKITNFWIDFLGIDASRPFVRRSPKSIMAIHLPPGQQQDLIQKFPDIKETAEKLGLCNTALEKALDYCGKQEGWHYPAKRLLWVCTYVGASLINARLAVAVTPEGLEQYGLHFPATLFISGGINILIDWLLCAEITERLLHHEAFLTEKSVEAHRDGILGKAYDHGAVKAFQRVQARYLKLKAENIKPKKPWFRLSKRLSALLFMFGIEYIAALGIALDMGDFQVQGILILFVPFVGIFLSSASGVYKATVLEFPSRKHKIAGRYDDVALETEDEGKLDARCRYADLVTVQFINNPDITPDDIEQQQRGAESVKQQRDFEREVQDRRRGYAEEVIEQDQAYDSDLAALDEKEKGCTTSRTQHQTLQLSTNHANRRYYRNRLTLIRRTLADLDILRSSYLGDSLIYQQFIGELEQQEGHYSERLDVFIKEHQALTNTAPRENNIHRFPLEGDDRASA